MSKLSKKPRNIEIVTFLFPVKTSDVIDKSKRNLHIMYELGVGYDVSNTKAPGLGLVVSAW